MSKKPAKTNTSAEHVKTADHAELSRLAEIAGTVDPVGPGWYTYAELSRYMEPCDARLVEQMTPAVCSALLSEISALRGEHKLTLQDGSEAWCSDAAWRWFQEWAVRLEQAERQRDELRRALDYARSHVLQSPCSDKQACLDQIDQAIANQGADQ